MAARLVIVHFTELGYCVMRSSKPFISATFAMEIRSGQPVRLDRVMDRFRTPELVLRQ
jgi:hypothetical protein